MAYRRINAARWPARCARCRQTVLAGSPCGYDKTQRRGRKIVCEPCIKPANKQTPSPKFSDPKKMPGANNQHVTTFGTFDEFVTQASNGEPCEDWQSFRASRDGEDEFSGYASFDGAVSLARTGWREGYEQTRDLTAKTLAGLPSQGRSETYELMPVGYFPDIGAYVSGSPFCMVTTDHGQDVPTTVYRMTVNLCVHGRVSPEAITAWGVALCAQVEQLERSGHSVDLIGALDSAQGRSVAALRVRLKSAGQPLDVDRMAFAIAHPGMLRRLGFSITEQTPFCASNMFQGSYGRVAFLQTPSDGIRIENHAGHSYDPAVCLQDIEAQFIEQTTKDGTE